MTEKLRHRSALQVCQHLEQLLLGELGLGGLGLGLCHVELYHQREIVRGEQSALYRGFLCVRVAGYGGLGQLDNFRSARGCESLHIVHKVVLPFRQGARGGVGVSVTLGYSRDARTGCIVVQNLHLVGLGGGGGSEFSQVFLCGVGGDFSVLDCLGQRFGGELGNLCQLGGTHCFKSGRGALVVVDLASGGEGVGVLSVDTKNLLSIVTDALEAVLFIGFGLHDLGEDRSDLTVLGVDKLGCVRVDSRNALSGFRQTGVFELARCGRIQLSDSDNSVAHVVTFLSYFQSS